MAQPSLTVPELEVHYAVPRWLAAWAVPEMPVPESDTHDAAIEWLRALLLSWVERSARDIKVARNLGIRWVREEPRAGFDPDLCLIEPSPPKDEPLTSLRLWQPEHEPPLLAIEVVSPGHPYKDYIDTPERCAASGVQELWIYDPMLVGPSARGGPHLLQTWSRSERRVFERTHAGSGAAFSPVLQAWLQPRASRLPAGARLYVSDDEAGQSLWVTAEQRARTLAQQARALLGAEQRERAALEERLRVLERQRR